MRVITGLARGCVLETLEGAATRPTGARAKDGIFSALQFDIAGRKVLDLFAGSGQMGIEALSRGADTCVFVDKSPHAIKIVRGNLATASKHSDVFKKNAKLIQADAFSFLQGASADAGTKKFDLIFLDPPFDRVLFNDTNDLLAKIEGVLCAGGLVVLEREFAVNDAFPEQVGALNLRKKYKYGRVGVALYYLDET